MRRVFIWQGPWRGGAGRITAEMARYLVAQGVDVTVGAFEHNPAYANLTQILFPAPRVIPSSFHSLYASLIFRWRYAKKFTAVYTHTLGAWKKPHLSLFVHDAADLDAMRQWQQGFVHHLAYLIWQRLYDYLCLRQATRIFSATQEFTNYLLRHGVEPARIMQSGSFYDDSVFTFQHRQDPASGITIIFVGDPTDPRKKFEYLKRSFYKNSRYRVWIAGGGQTTIDHNFQYWGYVNERALNELLKQAHFFILPSAAEGFSVALLEALATGLPCLVNQAAINTEVAGMRTIIPFGPGDNIHVLIDRVVRTYAHYNEPDAALLRYTRHAILEREYAAMKTFFASSER